MYQLLEVVGVTKMSLCQEKVLLSRVAFVRVSLDKNNITLLEEMITTLAQLVSYPSKHENFTLSNIA